jgi:stearoyl-CoA desaturase (delta-9 desaturase)
MSMIELNHIPVIPAGRVEERIRRAQRRHAGLLLTLPALGVLAAARELLLGRVQAWHLALLCVTYLLTMLGLTVGFHRLLTHRAFKTTTPVRALLTILGSMAGQGPPLYWVSNHRLHHQRSDQDGDPHSPHVSGEQVLSGWAGLWHAHAGWAFEHALVNPMAFCKDLMRDPALRWVNARYLTWLGVSLLIPGLFGALMGGARGAYEGLLWGGLVRLFFNFHITCTINSIAHYYGYQVYKSKDESRNNPWLAIPTLGEGWHNNHHAFPNSAAFGLEWWEIDLGDWLIRLLSWLGLASEVVRPSRQTKEMRRLGQASDEA